MKHVLPALALALTLAACNPVATDDTEQNASVAAKRAAVEWVAEEDSGAGNDAAPQITLMLQISGSHEEIYRTTCTGVPSTEVQDMEGSVASIQCWWAGGGDQYGVFVDTAESLIVRHRTVDEEAGFGAWEDVASL